MTELFSLSIIHKFSHRPTQKHTDKTTLASFREAMTIFVRACLPAITSPLTALHPFRPIERKCNTRHNHIVDSFRRGGRVAWTNVCVHLCVSVANFFPFPIQHFRQSPLADSMFILILFPLILNPNLLILT